MWLAPEAEMKNNKQESAKFGKNIQNLKETYYVCKMLK
jgi:hypothetical protein